jgi:hypothetical protein
VRASESVSGGNTWTLLIKDDTGAPADGLTLTVKCGMVGHSHGCSGGGPQIKALGSGEYELSRIVFGMRGQWHIQIDLEGGTVADSALLGEFCVQ